MADYYLSVKRLRSTPPSQTGRDSREHQLRSACECHKKICQKRVICVCAASGPPAAAHSGPFIIASSGHTAYGPDARCAIPKGNSARLLIPNLRSRRAPRAGRARMEEAANCSGLFGVSYPVTSSWLWDACCDWMTILRHLRCIRPRNNYPCRSCDLPQPLSKRSEMTRVSTRLKQPRKKQR
jgi:hypothetical protein